MNVITLTCPLCSWSARQQIEDDADRLIVAEFMADALLEHIQIAHRAPGSIPWAYVGLPEDRQN